MIEINLLPEELRVKTKGRAPEAVQVANPQVLAQDQIFVYAIGLVLVLFILAHFYFVALSLSRNGKLASLNRRWQGLAQQRKALDEFNGEASPAGGGDSAVVSQLSRQRVLWAQKLNILSLELPSGVWFNDITINARSITIQGSVISLQKEEISLIDKLMDSLKTDPEFSKDCSGFELGKIQKRTVGGYDIADFVLTGNLKPR